MSEAGEIRGEGLIPTSRDGSQGFVLEFGTEVKGCVEMMSGAVWVRDQLSLAGGRWRLPTPERSETWRVSSAEVHEVEVLLRELAVYPMRRLEFELLPRSL